MIYPNNFEEKIEFDYVRNILNSYCLTDLGKDKLKKMVFCREKDYIELQIKQTIEFVEILKTDEFPELNFYDLRICIKRIRIEDTFLSLQELYQLFRSLSSLSSIIKYLNTVDDSGKDNSFKYPNLQKLTLGKNAFPNIYKCISIIINDFGEIKDSASPNLAKIRREKSVAERNVSKVLHNILKQAHNDGYIDENTAPSIRDGRLVIPVAPAYKRKISGIIHDESDSGKTVFIEPTQVVEANNLITELENEERKEIIRILKNVTSIIRPYIPELLQSFDLLADIDFIRSKAFFCMQTDSRMPEIVDTPLLYWIHAIHPLLKIHFDKKNDKQEVIPLDINLLPPKQRILLISGPNAGGKSVCLKTVGLLQYMLQCGMPIPVSEDSKCGLFKDLFINIGDEQSIENELSTFSSHLVNMKSMMKYSDNDSLLLIDEFGGGTEPLIGGALAQAMLRKLNDNKVFAIITTHFQNLKQYAQETDGIVNGAMLYDRTEMRPLFQLRVGIPGSSFAVEIARKIGIPREVIEEASSIVGSDYISSDKYIQDIIRDKRYWENKRNEIHQKEKKLEAVISQYEADIKKLKEEKKKIIDKAKDEAEIILSKSNSIIERTIKEIKESQAEKEQTKEARQILESFKKEVALTASDELDAYIQRKVEKIKARQKRKAEQQSKNTHPTEQQSHKDKKTNNTIETELGEGDYVRLKNQQTTGKILKINDKDAIVAFGLVQIKVKRNQLEPSSQPLEKKRTATFISRDTQENIRETTLNFKTEIDIRGMRVDEAIQAITYFIDDAQVASAHRVRILHGTGSGILRTVIREYLSTIPTISLIRDEHPQFGGTGITIAEFEYK